ncbi:Cilia- and flagella-associated protein 45-like [Homarus americanus]|uniref:Cilia- and flagella-associated protein 45 n=1 Tax=Homarus americanus TaxID=6706 RepID=A0A8J5TVK9_HOMAM|nr:Cilia- and flagella-associated protein 45-like [Homarus americanus]
MRFGLGVMDQGGVRMIGLSGRGRPRTAPRLGDTPADPFGVAGVKLLERKNQPTPETVVVVARDSVRHLRCRSAIEPQPSAVLLSSNQLQAIRRAAQQAKEAARRTLEEKEERRRQHEKIEARHRRRRQLDEIKCLEEWPPGDHQAKETLEEDDRRGREELEREEEVKDLRKMVLAAKCHAIREAQILEKQHIRKLEKEEEERQAIMMEEARVKGLKEEKEREKAKQEVNQLAAVALAKQIQQSELLRYQQFRDKKKEANNVAKEAEKYNTEKELEKRKKKEKMMKEKKEARRVKEEAEVKKEELLKTEKLRDVQMMKEMKAQEAVKEARQEEEAAARRAKEDLQRLWLNDQERKLEERRKRDELKRLRELEKLEREWRTKELTEARAKAQREAEVTKERRQQVEDRQKARMAVAMKQKEELLRVTDHWMITEERERSEHQHAKKAKEDYESRIRGQIKEQEARRAKEADRLRQEKEEAALQIKLRQAALTRLKLDTMQELRKMALPEQLVLDLEKKLNLKKNKN